MEWHGVFWACHVAAAVFWNGVGDLSAPRMSVPVASAGIRRTMPPCGLMEWRRGIVMRNTSDSLFMPRACHIAARRLSVEPFLFVGAADEVPYVDGPGPSWCGIPSRRRCGVVPGRP